MLQLLLNADVFAPEPLGVQHLLIAGGRLAWMGTVRPEVPKEWDVAIHDLKGARVIPGLIDGHAHVTGGGGEAGPQTRVPAVPLSRFTRGGITTVVGLLGTDDVTRSTADLVATTRGLVAEGMTAFCYTGGYHLPATTLTGSVRGDIVHIDCILGVGELAISDHRSSQPTLDELLRVAADAHVAGLMTGKAGICHLHLGDGARGLDLVRQALDQSELPARVFQPTHVNRRKALFEEAGELALRGCHIDLTAFPVEPGEDAYTAEDALERYWAAEWPQARVTVSSDGGGCLPHFDGDGRVSHMGVGQPAALAQCLATLLERGHPLGQALPPFTSNVADLLRLDKKGRLRVGADADLVVLSDQGLPEDVMLQGVWHVREQQPVVCGTFETFEGRQA
ncbi:MAG: beta-aspartyl-peptidase [Planctomycetes bacterium]|nr:beta-aspartyl-peptidase [Planctomycetota bacterium]MCB9911933.1 beta-aspartyl-peptidase [Planctomycetota bacterium]HPF13555.1 beta-aspartyl-peptidase [Planctomycetota bacterium]